jgi:hypothetical protein
MILLWVGHLCPTTYENTSPESHKLVETFTGDLPFLPNQGPNLWQYFLDALNSRSHLLIGPPSGFSEKKELWP